MARVHKSVWAKQEEPHRMGRGSVGTQLTGMGQPQKDWEMVCRLGSLFQLPATFPASFTFDFLGKLAWKVAILIM